MTKTRKILKARLLAVLFAAGFSLALAACTMSEPRRAPGPVEVGSFAPIAVNAAAIEIENAYHPPMGAPNVDHLFAVPPAAAIDKLLRHQLAAQGAENVLRVTIEDASVVREALPVKKSFFSAFSPAPAEKFTARAAIRFELADSLAPDIIRGRASVTAVREETLGNDASPADRDAAWHALTQGLVNDLGAQMAKTVRGTFGRE